MEGSEARGVASYTEAPRTLDEQKIRRLTQYCESADRARVELMTSKVTDDNRAHLLLQVQNFERIYAQPLRAIGRVINGHTQKLVLDPEFAETELFLDFCKNQSNLNPSVYSAVTVLRLEINRLGNLLSDVTMWKQANKLDTGI